MKFIFRIFLFITLIGIIFTSCQKKDILGEGPQFNEELIVNASKTFNVGIAIEKGFVITKIDTVYILQGDGTLKEHRTIKMRNLQWTVAQEWLLDDLHTDGIQDWSIFPGDTDGSQHGHYWPWADQIEDVVDNGDWEYIVFSDQNYTPISGNSFHLPKIDTYSGANDGDITKLASILGSTFLVRQKLQMDYDGTATGTPPFSSDYTCMWIEVRGTTSNASRVPGCGVFAYWDIQTNNDLAYYYTNMPNTKVNTRLVRNITQNEW